MDADTLSRLLSLTSHELRSPLGVIRGYLKWLEQQGGTLPDQHRQVVAGSVKASDRLAELLTELSALAQLMRRETPIAAETVRLDTLGADLAAAFAIHRHTVTITLGELPTVTLVGDRGLLQAALDSLATAVSLARPRDTAVVLRGHRDPSGTPVVRLELAAPDPAPDLVETPLNLSRGGLGLRLAMAAEIIDAHGGRVAEQHGAGRLSGMIVWLPVADP